MIVELPLHAGESNGLRWAQGLTLIELMIVLAIGAILLTVAVPAFDAALKATRLKGQASEFRQALTQARQLAVNRGEQVVVCRSTDGSSCSSGNWEDGWLVFIDDDPQNEKVNSGEEVPAVNQGLQSNYSLRTGGDDTITFRTSGGTNDFDERFRLCGPDGETADAREISLNAAGRAVVRNDTSNWEGAVRCP
jgi:type IV fimbrial biogenesis protein FimT